MRVTRRAFLTSGVPAGVALSGCLTGPLNEDVDGTITRPASELVLHREQFESGWQQVEDVTTTTPEGAPGAESASVSFFNTRTEVQVRSVAVVYNKVRVAKRAFDAVVEGIAADGYATDEPEIGDEAVQYSPIGDLAQLIAREQNVLIKIRVWNGLSPATDARKFARKQHTRLEA